MFMEILCEGFSKPLLANEATDEKRPRGGGSLGRLPRGAPLWISLRSTLHAGFKRSRGQTIAHVSSPPTAVAGKLPENVHARCPSVHRGLPHRPRLACSPPRRRGRRGADLRRVRPHPLRPRGLGRFPPPPLPRCPYPRPPR